MRVAQIKAELKERSIAFSDCFDKDGLVDRLRAARAGLVRPMQVRQSAGQNHVADQRGAAKGECEFGAESRQGEEDDLEAAFRAAGWTGGEAKDPSNVDTARSPGMSRNFGGVPQSDFKKPYSGGAGKKKGRYD